MKLKIFTSVSPHSMASARPRPSSQIVLQNSMVANRLRLVLFGRLTVKPYTAFDVRLHVLVIVLRDPDQHFECRISRAHPRTLSAPRTA